MMAKADYYLKTIHVLHITNIDICPCVFKGYLYHAITCKKI